MSADGDKRYDLAGTGSMVVDAIHRVPQLPTGDGKVLLAADPQGRVVQRLVGGVALNHLGWARLFGLRTAIFGKQADDAHGRFLRAGMQRLGIEHALDLTGSASSFAQVYVDRDGGRAIYMGRGATGELTADEIDTRHRDTIRAARVVTTEVSQVPLDAVCRVLELARAAGALTVLDVDVPRDDAVPALGSAEQLERALALAQVIKPSQAALAGLVSGDAPEARARALAERSGAEVVAVTLGAEGALLWHAGAARRVPAARVRAVDTTGAGDAFLGGLLAGRHLGLDWPAAARLGNACGAACCEQWGGFPDPPESARKRALELHGELGGGELALELHGSAAPSALARFLDVAPRELERAAAALDRAAVTAAARQILAAEADGGRVHVTGIGKPEHVAHYAASLLASTGTAATFLHATETTHGSVGQVRPGDVVVALSNSGGTDELLRAVAALRAAGARLVAVTRDPASPLARAADHVLVARVEQEGGPLNLAPRASILAQTLTVAALSVELQERRGFTRADYAARHPAGALGERARAHDPDE